MTPQTKTVGIDIRLIGKKRTGDETVFFQLVRELIRRHDVDVRYQLFTDESEEDRLATLRLKLEALGRPDIEIVSLPARNRFLWNALVLPWRLFTHPIDVFHTQYILPLFLPKRLRVVTHIHDVSFRAHPEWIGWVDRFFLSLFLPKTWIRSQAIVVPSRFTQSEIEHYYPNVKGRVTVIENAAAPEWFEPIAEAEIQRVTSKHGLQMNQYLISSGTMQPRKNIPLLIQAFQEMVRIHAVPFSLVLTGSRAGHNVDSDALVQAKQVIFTGYVSDADLRALVAGARGFVFPSRYEGFGIPIEEALAVGTPVLASDIPVFHEVGGERIQYCDTSSLAPLAENLYTFSIAQANTGALEASRSREQSAYRWPQSAAKLVEVYRSLST